MDMPIAILHEVKQFKIRVSKTLYSLLSKDGNGIIKRVAKSTVLIHSLHSSSNILKVVIDHSLSAFVSRSAVVAQASAVRPLKDMKNHPYPPCCRGISKSLDLNILSTTQGHLRMIKLCHKQRHPYTNPSPSQVHRINPYINMKQNIYIYGH